MSARLGSLLEGLTGGRVTKFRLAIVVTASAVAMAAAQVGMLGASAAPEMRPASTAAGEVIQWGDHPYVTDVPPEALSGVDDVSVGSGHSLALKDGKVIAWGYNDYGQATVPPEAQSGVSAIAAADWASMALKDGKVLFWGYRGDGIFRVPEEAQSGVDAIAGHTHYLALKSGKVLAWGNARSEILDVPLEAQSGVTAIAAASGFSLALKDGRVIAWGLKDEQALSVPEEAQSGVTAIAAGNHLALALKQGRVIAWGWSNSGATQVPVEARSGVTEIAAGSAFGLALKNGKVIGWGANDRGQTSIPAAGLSGVTVIAAGTSSLAVRSGPVITPPGPVLQLKAVAERSAVRVTWAPPTDTGGAPSVTYSYRVGTGQWKSTSASSVRIAGKKGKAIRISVAAVNQVGTGPVLTVRATPR